VIHIIASTLGEPPVVQLVKPTLLRLLNNSPGMKSAVPFPDVLIACSDRQNNISGQGLLVSNRKTLCNLPMVDKLLIRPGLFNLPTVDKLLTSVPAD
jgi:hypothetical protein